MQKQSSKSNGSSSSSKGGRSASQNKAPALKKGKVKSSAPLAQQAIMRIQKPTLTTSYSKGDGRVSVRHREYIADISGSVAFAVTRYAINPGMFGTFPWLSTIARNYESYLFKRLCFEYETQKSTAENGSVMVAIDFDASDTTPASKLQTMSYQNAVRSAVWQECCYEADGEDLRKFGSKRYLRSGSLQANQDIKTYDVGALFVATQGCADTSAIGELYVVYDVELQTPQLDTEGFLASSSLKAVGNVSVSATNIFGSTPITTGGAQVGVANNLITFFAPGQYVVWLFLTGTAITNGVLGTTATGFASSLFNPTITIGAGATTGEALFIVRALQPNDTLTITGVPAAVATVSASSTRFASYAYSLA